jgi:hypothetical protein
MSAGVANGPAARSPWSLTWPPALALAALLTFVFIYSGAFDTDHLGFGHRLALWSIVSALFVGQPLLFERLAARFLPARPYAPLAAAGVAILVCVPLTAVELHLMKFTPLLPKAPDPWAEFIPFVAPPVIAVSIAALAIRWTWERAHLSPREPAPESEAAPAPSGLHLDASTLFVRAQDHYLEIVTENGRRFVRGRLADIEAEAAALPGLRAHRSWWIADKAVAGAQRQGRDVKLVLSTGESAPLSRARLDQAKALGWLEREAAA